MSKGFLVRNCHGASIYSFRKKASFFVKHLTSTVMKSTITLWWTKKIQQILQSLPVLKMEKLWHVTVSQVDKIFLLYLWWHSFMHRDVAPGISISHHYVEDIEILHHLNELVSVWSKFYLSKKYLLQGKFFSGYYRI